MHLGVPLETFCEVILIAKDFGQLLKLSSRATDVISIIYDTSQSCKGHWWLPESEEMDCSGIQISTRIFFALLALFSTKDNHPL